MGLVAYTDDILAAVDRWDGVLRRPSAESRQRPEGVQILKSSMLERIFATSYWFMPAVWFGPIIGYGLYRSLANPTLSLPWTATLFVAGVLFWTLTEYVLHRFLFHLRPGGWWKPSKLRLFMLHGYHHEYPNDRMRLVAPPVMSWPIGGVIIAGFLLLAGPQYGWGLIAGTATGYLGYDWIHYYTHHAKPRTRVGRFVQRYHLAHHYKDQSSHFGISSPLWDLVFRTFRPKEPRVAQTSKRSAATS